MGVFFILHFPLYYSGKVAPVGWTTKSNTMNSAVLVGWINIWPTNWFLSTTSGVLFVSSITTLNAVSPAFAWTCSIYGFTMFKKRLLKALLFCSNTKNLEDDAINFLKLINNLLTFILSKALGLPWSVFWPNTTTPWPGKVAIGLIRFSYKSSLSKFVSLVCASNTSVKPPRFKPAGANHSCPILSEFENTPGRTTEGGTQVGLFLTSSRILTQG